MLGVSDDRLVAPEKRLFCLSVSMGSNVCLPVKLSMKLYKKERKG